ncbi:MAG TPA: hypothetical protein VJ810_23765 [Blastocatellia bacterium]|nr:hypothetical protein [Blastocatellia bacterium]
MPSLLPNYVNMIQNYQSLLGRKRKNEPNAPGVPAAPTIRTDPPVAPPIAPDVSVAPQINPAVATTPGINPDAPMPPFTGRWNPDGPLPNAPANLPRVAPTFDPALALEMKPPASMNPQPETPPHWFKSVPGRSVGGAPLSSAEEGDFLQERGMIRPRNNFSMKERVIEALKSGVTGAFQGLAQTGDLGGALGGFTAGAGFGAVDPRVGARMRFATSVEPQLMTQKRREQEQMQAQAALEAKQIENVRSRGQIDLDKANAERARAQAEAALRPKPTQSPAPQMKLGRNRSTGQVGYYDTLNPAQAAQFEAYQFPRQQSTGEPSTAEKLRRADTEEIEKEGTIKQIAQDVVRGQRGSIIASAPEPFRSLLQSGKRADGEAATAKDVEQAQDWLNKEMDRRYREQLRITESIREQNKAKRVRGATPSSNPGASGLKRNVNELPPLR